MTRIESELSKMRCNQLEIFWCIKELSKNDRPLTVILSEESISEKQRLGIAKRSLLSECYTEKESWEILVYIETYELLAKRLKNCTDLDTLKADNAIATDRINRLSKSCQNIAHRAVCFGADGGQRITKNSNRHENNN